MIKRCCFLAVLSILLGASFVRASFEKGGLLGTTPRDAAMGGASSAVAEDAISARANPAGLVHMQGPHLLTAGGMVTDVGQTFSAFGGGAIVEGLGVSVLVVQKSFNSTTERIYAAGLAIPVEELPWLSLGGSLKRFAVDFPLAKAGGFGFDAGALARFQLPARRVELRASAGIEDAMASLKWNDGLHENLTRQTRLSVGVVWDQDFSVLVQMQLIRGEGRSEDITSFGLEKAFVLYGVPLAVRAGWRGGQQRDTTFTGGIGARFGPASLDYAVVDMTQSQGNVHLFSAMWAFGGGSLPVIPGALAMTEKEPKALEAEPEPDPGRAEFIWDEREELVFDDFLKSGFALDARPQKDTVVVATTKPASVGAFQGEHVIVRGDYRPGQVLAVYRVSPRACAARFVGTIRVQKSSEESGSRGVVTRSLDAVKPGDVLVSIDSVREEYVQQRRIAEREPAGGGEGVVGSVKCFADGRNFMAAAHDTLMVNKGREDGVALGWLFELVVPGRDRELTSGRVVRVDPRASFVQLRKIYQPVQAGDRARLSPSSLLP